MAGITARDLLLPAAFALVSERCRNAYLHDLKGGLQSLHSAVELLSRSAGMSAANPAMVEKAGSLAKRALNAHESELQSLWNQTCPGPEPPTAVDLGRLVADVLQFLRNDALEKSLTTDCELADNVELYAEAGQLRMLVLGLCVTSMDGLPPKSRFNVSVNRERQMACLRISSTVMDASASLGIDAWLADPMQSISSHQFLLAVTARWAKDRGGDLTVALDTAEATATLQLPISRSSNA